MRLQPGSDHKKRWILIIIALLILLTLVGAMLLGRLVRAPGKPAVNLKETSKQASRVQSDSGLQADPSTTDPASLWVVVNKPHPLTPKDYAPTDLTNIGGGVQLSAKAAPSLQQLISDAKKAGHSLIIQSGYRSYVSQTSLYNSYVAKDGQALADTYSARPGHSEHQTGLAADIGGGAQPSCNLETCFGQTSEGKWLASNAERYGFIIRYTTANQAVTGYSAEPWHVRFIGLELVGKMKQRHLTTLEEFFAVSGGPVY